MTKATFPDRYSYFGQPITTLEVSDTEKGDLWLGIREVDVDGRISVVIRAKDAKEVAMAILRAAGNATLADMLAAHVG